MKITHGKIKDFTIEGDEVSFLLEMDPIDESQIALFGILVKTAISNGRVRLQVQRDLGMAEIISDWKVTYIDDCVFKIRTKI